MNADDNDPADPSVRRGQTRCIVDWYRTVPGQMVVGPPPADGSDPPILDCELVDLSTDGCAIRLESAPEATPRVVIVRFVIEGGPLLQCAARVCWDRQTSIGWRSYGLRFRHPIDADCLEGWIAQGVVSRRSTDRNDVDEPVTLRVGGGGVSQATIANFSRGGMAIRSDTTLKPGSRLLVTLGDGRGVMVGVVWSTGSAGRYVNGVKFVTREGGADLVRYFEAKSDREDAAGEGSIWGRLRETIGV